MKKDELMKLTNFYKAKEKLAERPKINYSQIKILLLILSFVICFLIYKIIYLISSIIYSKESNNKKLGKNIVEYNVNKEAIKEINQLKEEDRKKKVYLSNLTATISYSEHLEDVILNVFFYEIHYGFYIDIGDFTPNWSEYSVTKHFYLKGWRGINIKPIKEEYLQLSQERYRDVNLNYYIGGKVDMNYTPQSSSVNISSIMQKYIPKNQEIHFCRIHTIGDEKKVLLGYDFINNRPKVFCVESENLRPNYQSFEYILINNQYSFGYQYKNVRYYMDNNEKKINWKERFNLLYEVLQGNKTRKYKK